MRECADAIALGVHPTAQGVDGARRMPPFVKRDVEASLALAFDEGGMVIIEGSSTAGNAQDDQWVRDDLADGLPGGRKVSVEG